jgi:hypothetical protein
MRISDRVKDLFDATPASRGDAGVSAVDPHAPAPNALGAVAPARRAEGRGRSRSTPAAAQGRNVISFATGPRLPSARPLPRDGP